MIEHSPQSSWIELEALAWAVVSGHMRAAQIPQPSERVTLPEPRVTPDLPKPKRAEERHRPAPL